jgi:hypothetical protein
MLGRPPQVAWRCSGNELSGKAGAVQTCTVGILWHIVKNSPPLLRAQRIFQAKQSRG